MQSTFKEALCFNFCQTCLMQHFPAPSEDTMKIHINSIKWPISINPPKSENLPATYVNNFRKMFNSFRKLDKTLKTSKKQINMPWPVYIFSFPKLKYSWFVMVQVYIQSGSNWYTYMWIRTFSDSFPLQIIARYWV